REPLRQHLRSMGRVLQNDLWEAEHYVAGGRGRGALFRLDRWAAEGHRPGELHDPLHAPQTRRYLEFREHQTRQGIDRSRAHEARGSPGLRGAQYWKVRHLFVRAEEARRTRPGRRATVPGEQEGVGVLPEATSLLSKGGHLVGREREESGNQSQETECTQPT